MFHLGRAFVSSPTNNSCIRCCFRLLQFELVKNCYLNSWAKTQQHLFKLKCKQTMSTDFDNIFITSMQYAYSFALLQQHQQFFSFLTTDCTRSHSVAETATLRSFSSEMEFLTHIFGATQCKKTSHTRIWSCSRRKNAFISSGAPTGLKNWTPSRLLRSFVRRSYSYTIYIDVSLTVDARVSADRLHCVSSQCLSIGC
jgi:hypothetical protein